MDSAMEDMYMGPTIPQVTLEYFLSSCLPPVDEEIFSKVYDNLKAKKVITKEGWDAMECDELEKRRADQGKESRKQRKRRKQNERRRKKEQNKEQVSQQRTPDGPGSANTPQQVDEPSQTSAGQPAATIHENDFFDPLTHCFNAVLDEANQVLVEEDHWREVLFKFRSNPRSSEATHESHKSDVYALLKESRAIKEPHAEDHESDVILPGEYRKDDNWVNQKENIRKLIGAVNHIMAYDLTRRFMFGITIEHKSTRFWFFSRSHAFVTCRVDLQKEAKQVISVILALGSATLHELGFDLTIERVFSGGISGSSLAMRTPGLYTLGTVANRDQLCHIVREHYDCKVHYRLLMKDAGSTLDDVPNLLTLLKCLKQVVKALQYMYSAGYVHRDISTRNVLYRYDVNGQISVHLCDLEYVKDVSQPREANQDVKMGTPHFIAVEVETGGYLFTSLSRSKATALHPSRALLLGSQWQNARNRQRAAGSRFVFNYLHDLESVWWIMVYTLFSKLPKGMVLEGERLKEHHAIRGQIFPHPNMSAERLLFLRDQDQRISYLDNLPNAFDSIGFLASLLGDYLQTQYELLEDKPEFPSGSCFADLHRTIFTDFLDETVYDKVVFSGGLCRVPPIPVEGPPPATRGKRKVGTEEVEKTSSSFAKEER
ncbi:hypothetical protein VNI00_001058 [Paramarasmius palmivorus]|uniref:Protein kinase domain-containing protein n=1 Tax=Paramarasmius palmivorus TaxID=297713 RepID=A0AAW0E542_9AGAR